MGRLSAATAAAAEEEEEGVAAMAASDSLMTRPFWVQVVRQPT